MSGRGREGAKQARASGRRGTANRRVQVEMGAKEERAANALAGAVVKRLGGRGTRRGGASSQFHERGRG